MRRLNLLSRALLFSYLAISGCALEGGLITTLGPDYHSPKPPTADRWYAQQPPIAHQGQLSDLTHWWERFGDPVLNQLQAAAQNASASIAQAKAQIVESRGHLISSESVFLPNLDLSLKSERASFSFGEAPFIRNQYSLSVQSSWEIDLFGGLARQREASTQQLAYRTAAWHDARVSVAAELANAYFAFRYCAVQSQIAAADAESRTRSARLIQKAVQTGFKRAADATLATASAADGEAALLRQHAQCEESLKSLVALTGLPEPKIRSLLGETPEQLAKFPVPPTFKINSVPANVIRQRPDIAAVERQAAEASAKIGVEEANRYPKLSLSGNITPVFQNINGAALTLAETWSYGPTISLPLFDAGKRKANVDTAQAQFEAALVQYRETVRKAVKEVEQALVRIVSLERRIPVSDSAAQNYQAHFTASQTAYALGFGTLMDAESARRDAISAKLAVKALQYEKITAWVALYRAVGGGWDAPTAVSSSTDKALPDKPITPSKKSSKITGESS